jgi:FHA domain
MSRYQPAPPMAPIAQVIAWSLEVVRGRKMGASYALGAGETTLGNALAGARGFDLSEQEGDTPRRMEGRHAVLSAAGPELTIRDLDSPGGTFVNRQRLLAGQTRRLQPGDLIQLGGVQLEVKQGGAPPAPLFSPTAPPAPHAAPRPAPVAVGGRLPAPFAFATAQCRTWDDFLVHAAQNWRALCDELTSGRLAEFLRRINRSDLVPPAPTNRSADDQLDDWLARIPATASSAPELDVHPETLLIKAATGGGITRHALRITNVGYRLLKCTARVEPPGTRWLRLRPEHDRRQLPTIDESDLPVEVELPDSLDRPLQAAIVIESNGGTRRISVRIERPSDEVVIPAAGATGRTVPMWGEQLRQWLAPQKPPARLAYACGGLVLMRLFLMLTNALPIGTRGDNALAPRLSSLAVVFVAVGAILAYRFATRRGDRTDLPAAGFAGGILGLLAAACSFAVVRSGESVLGSWASSFWAVLVLWAALGASTALLSILIVPFRATEPEAAR